MSERPAIECPSLADDSDTSILKQVLLRANESSQRRSGQQTWPFTETALKHLGLDISDGTVFCLRGNDGEPYASVSITTRDKKGIWKDVSDGQSAVYFSKLMKDPSIEQTDVVTILLDQVIKEARQNGFSIIRCDAVASNEKLLAYYYRLGFEPKGQSLYPYTGDTRIAQLLETNCDALESKLSTP